jgi:hypothetical protein
VEVARAAQAVALQQPGVVRRVVGQLHDGRGVEALDQQAVLLVLRVGEGAAHDRHPARPQPRGRGVQQGAGSPAIVLALEGPEEAGRRLVQGRVRVVDHRLDAADRAARPPGQEERGVGVGEERVARLREQIPALPPQGRHEAGVAPVQPVGKIDELLVGAPRLGGDDLHRLSHGDPR